MTFACALKLEITVERADASVEPSKRGRGRPKKLAEAKIVVPPTVLEKEQRVIIGEEARTEAMEEPDILADQRAMQCPDWALEGVAPNKAQLNLEQEPAGDCEWCCDTGDERSDRSSDLYTSSARGNVHRALQESLWA